MTWLSRFLVPSLRHCLLAGGALSAFAMEMVEPVVIQKAGTSYEQVSYRMGSQTITQSIRLDRLAFMATDDEAAANAVAEFGSISEIGNGIYQLDITAVEASPLVLQQAHQALLNTPGVSAITRSAERGSESSIGNSAIIALEASQDIAALAATYCFTVDRQMTSFDRVYVVEFNDLNLSRHANALTIISQLPGVRFAYFNRQVNLSKLDFGDDDPSNDDPYITGEFENRIQWNMILPGFPETWRRTRGEGVNIAIVDDGLDVNHDDFQADFDRDSDGEIIDENQIRESNVVDAGFDFANNDTNPARGDRGAFDDESHSTAVAGCAAARDNGLYGAGAAPRAGIISLRIIETTGSTDANIAEALQWRFDDDVDTRVSVSNNSWGYGFPATILEDPLAEEAIVRAQREGRDGKGVVFVFASGNSRTNFNFFFLDIPEAELPDYSIYEPYPNLSGVINVGAVDGIGVRAEYSEGGPNLLVVAPAGSRNTTGGAVTADVTGAEGYNAGGGLIATDPEVIFDDGNYSGIEDGVVGTSFASPVVAGLCAQILSLNEELTYRDVMHILVESATRVSPGDAGYIKNSAGYFFSPGYGFGMIDAPTAIGKAANWVPLPPVSSLSGTWPADGGAGALDIPDDKTSRTVSISISNPDDLVIDEVFLDIHAVHPQRGQLEFTVESPGRTLSVIPARIWDGESEYLTTFRLLNFWGEEPEGDWRVMVKDTVDGKSGGQLLSASLRVQGWEPFPRPRIELITTDSFTSNAIFANADGTESDIELIIDGRDFVEASRARFGSTLLTTRYEDETTLYADLPVSLLLKDELNPTLNSPYVDNEVPITVVSPSYQGQGGGASDPYYASVGVGKPVITTTAPIYVELGDTWVYGMQASQALFGDPQPLVFSFDPNDSTDGLVVNKTGVATFTWNSATAGVPVGDQVVIDLQVSGGGQTDRQRCVVTVVAPGSTKPAVGKLEQEVQP